MRLDRHDGAGNSPSPPAQHKDYPGMAETSDRQAQHYDRILSDYDQHYYDAQSTVYRERFILGPLVEGLDLNGKEVADLACGSGETSLFLRRRFPGVRTTGFDIRS